MGLTNSERAKVAKMSGQLLALIERADHDLDNEFGDACGSHNQGDVDETAEGFISVLRNLRTIA